MSVVNAGRDRGKKRQQGIENNAVGNRHEPAVEDFVVGTEQNVLPALPRDVDRRSRLASPGRLRGARELQVQRTGRHYEPPTAEASLSSLSILV